MVHISRDHVANLVAMLFPSHELHVFRDQLVSAIWQGVDHAVSNVPHTDDTIYGYNVYIADLPSLTEWSSTFEAYQLVWLFWIEVACGGARCVEFRTTQCVKITATSGHWVNINHIGEVRGSPGHIETWPHATRATDLLKHIFMDAASGADWIGRLCPPTHASRPDDTHISPCVVTVAHGDGTATNITEDLVSHKNDDNITHSAKMAALQTSTIYTNVAQTPDPRSVAFDWMIGEFGPIISQRATEITSDEWRQESTQHTMSRMQHEIDAMLELLPPQPNYEPLSAGDKEALRECAATIAALSMILASNLGIIQ